MARIKQVLNERRLAYDQAVKLHQDGVTLEQLEAAEAENIKDAVTEPSTVGMFEAEPTSEAPRDDNKTSPAGNKPNAQ